MSKISKNIYLFLILSFAIYCALIIGRSWDEGAYILLGKERLSYLLSLGMYETTKPFWNSHHYPGISYSLNAFVLSMFKENLEFKLTHLFNLSISLSAVFGIAKISKELFNKKISVIIFIIFLLYPAYFGHMAINANDTVIASCSVWITYLILRYLKKQNGEKRKKYIILASVALAIGTGVRLVFIGSILPVIFFVLFDIFLFKKFACDKFSKRKFFLDLFIIAVLSILIVIIFWAPTHSNIFILPFEFFFEMFSDERGVGWPLILLNGKYYFSNDVPIYYLILNLLYKTPEYLLFLFFLSIFFIFSKNSFFEKNFKNFNYKILFIFTILFFPNILLFFNLFPVYDGLRLFLFIIPFFLLLPSLAIFILITELSKTKYRILSFSVLLLIIIFMIKFVAITPYHYVYINFLTGNFEKQSKKFENDYWGVSLKELIKKSDFLNQDYNKLALCGVNKNIVKYYLRKFGYSKVNVVRSDEEFDYILMTNRSVYEGSNDPGKAKTCFEKYPGSTISYVKRYGLLLSQIKQ